MADGDRGRVYAVVGKGEFSQSGVLEGLPNKNCSFRWGANSGGPGGHVVGRSYDGESWWDSDIRRAFLDKDDVNGVFVDELDEIGVGVGGGGEAVCYIPLKDVQGQALVVSGVHQGDPVDPVWRGRISP